MLHLKRDYVIYMKKNEIEIKEMIYDKLFEIEHDLDNINKTLKYVFVAFIFTIIGGIII